MSSDQAGPPPPERIDNAMLLLNKIVGSLDTLDFYRIMPQYHELMEELRKARDGSRSLLAYAESLMNDKATLIKGVRDIVEREIRRAESMSGNTAEYPKEYVDGRYRTGVEIAGQVERLLKGSED